MGDVMTTAHKKFGFDTVFDATGDVTFAMPRPKRLFSIEEVGALKRAAFAEGEEMANSSLLARQTEALGEIVKACEQALPRLAQVAHEHRTASARLAMACGRAIAGAQEPEILVRMLDMAVAQEADRPAMQSLG